MLTDLPLAELRRYVPEVAEPANFDSFWSEQLGAARTAARAPEFTPVSTAIRYADVFDVTFSGFAGDPVKGWLLVPHDPAPRRAVVVEYIGYGGGRGDPLDWLPGAAPATSTWSWTPAARAAGGSPRTRPTPATAARRAPLGS
jgi:cephalosporin-C deacetylase